MLIRFAFVLIVGIAGCRQEPSPIEAGTEDVKAEGVRADPKETSPFQLDRDKHQVTRFGANGDVVWTVKFDEDIGGVRPPHLIFDERHVYLTHKNGVTALDAANGKIQWHTHGPRRGLLLSDGLLLGTGPVANNDGTFSHWLFACDSAKGNVKFETRLPEAISDPAALEQVAGLFLVQIGEAPDGKGHALLFDRQGAVRHRLDRQVVRGKKYADDIVILTSQNVVRLTARDKIMWTVRFDHHQWIAGGDLVETPDGDLIASQFGHIDDSGVSVIRFDPTSGRVRWKQYCRGLGVPHSAYHHSAKVAVDGERLRVTSEGSGGTFIEILDLKTGRLLKRTGKP